MYYVYINIASYSYYNEGLRPHVVRFPSTMRMVHISFNGCEIKTVQTNSRLRTEQNKDINQKAKEALQKDLIDLI